MTEAVAELAEQTFAVTERTAALVDRMTDELGLWETRVDAGLFLVGLAVAHEADPVPAEDREAADAELGTLAASEVDDRDQLAILGVLDDEERELAETLDEQLAGWAEAGAGLLEERIDGADAVEATAAIAEMARDL